MRARLAHLDGRAQESCLPTSWFHAPCSTMASGCQPTGTESRVPCLKKATTTFASPACVTEPLVAGLVVRPDNLDARIHLGDAAGCNTARHVLLREVRAGVNAMRPDAGRGVHALYAHQEIQLMVRVIGPA